MVQARQVLILAALFLGSGALAQDRLRVPDGATPALRRALEAGPYLRLAGKRTVVFGRNKERLTERVLQDGQKLRIESSNGTITVVNGGDRSVYDPAKNEIYVTYSPYGHPGYGFLSRPGRAKLEVDYKESDGGEVAGRPTRLVLGTGKRGEVLFRANIDTSKGAVLRAEVYGPGGKLVMSFEYERVQYDVDIPSRAFHLNYPGAKIVTVRDEIARLAAKMGIKPYVIDKSSGLRLENARVFEADGRKIMRQTYAGDRMKVSLFLCKGEVNPNRLTRFGGERLRSRVWTVGDLTLVLLGEASNDELSLLQRQVVEQRD